MQMRYAYISDGDKLASVYLTALEKTFQEAKVDTPLPSQKEAASIIVCDNITVIERTILIAENDEGSVMGFVSFGSMLEMWKGHDVTGEVYMLYVHPDFWRQGVGEALIERAMEDLKEKGHDRLLLWIVDGAKGAEEFYIQKGWQKTSLTRPDFEHAPIKRRCMTIHM